MADKLTLNEDLFESFGRPDSWNNDPDNDFIVDLGDRDDVCVSFEDAVKSADKNNVDVITEQPPYSNKVIRKWVRDVDGNFKLSENESLDEDLFEKLATKTLNESFVEEWWNEVLPDPFDFAAKYNLNCEKIDSKNDEILYRYSGAKKDIEKAIRHGYFSDLVAGKDENHSKDLSYGADCKSFSEAEQNDLRNRLRKTQKNGRTIYYFEPSQKLLDAADKFMQENNIKAPRQSKGLGKYVWRTSWKRKSLIPEFEELNDKFDRKYDGQVFAYYWPRDNYAYFVLNFAAIDDALNCFKAELDESLNEARDFEWDDTLWAVVKEDGRFAGIPCITDTEAREVAYQHEGSHIYKMTLEDSLDEDLILAPQEDALEGPQTEEEVGVSHLILDAISCVTEMISMYNDITANTNDEEIIEVINQIAEDNNKHMGMLQGILTDVSPNAEAIQDGVEEVSTETVEESLTESEEEDGWDEEKVYAIKEVCDDIHNLSYELENCVKGAYTNATTYPELGAYVSELGDRLSMAGEELEGMNESIEEPLQEDLHDKFKKDIKNAYKQWAAEVEKVEQQRKDLKDKFQDVESEEKRKEYEELTDKLFPMPADFKFEFPKNIEKDDFPFYVTYYAEYPIYEPAEGGYYYAGKDAIWSEGVNSEEEAWEYVNDFINEQEDKTEWEKFSDGYLLRGQYIGENQSIIIEPRDSYLSAVKGWEPYQ